MVSTNCRCACRPWLPSQRKEAAVFGLNWLSATGTGILISGLISGLVMGFSITQIFKDYLKTIMKVRFSLLTIAAMLAIGFMTRYSGLDATMGSGVRSNRPFVSVLRHSARLAGRGAHRFGYFVQRAVRQPAEDLGATGRRLTGPDVGGQQLRRCDGQDDRCPEHRRRQYRNQLVRA